MNYFNGLMRTVAGRISQQAFVRLMLAISGAWLLAIYPALNWFCGEKLPHRMHMGGVDFGQYYAGALVARHGLWPHLYPTPDREIYENPPRFSPRFSTKLFDPNASKERQGNWLYYLQIADPYSSSIAPEVLALCPELKDKYRFMYPPPLAVLLWPLGYFGYTAACGIWFTLMCFSIFGISYFSSRICRVLWERTTYVEGWVALLPVIPTWLASDLVTTLAIGNVTPFLGFLITWIAYAWVCGRQAAIGVGIIPLLLFKGVGLSWCPLFLVKPVKWKTLGVLASLTVILNAIALYYGGVGLYRTYFLDVLPKADVALGWGVQGLLLCLIGVDSKLWISVLNIFLLAVLYWKYWCRSRVSADPQCPGVILAALAGTIAILCLCNGVVWHSYYTNFLLFPFSGWILWEGYHSTGAWRKWVFRMFFLSFVFWFLALMPMKGSRVLGALQHAGVYNKYTGIICTSFNILVINALGPLECCFLLALAYRRLSFCARK